MNRLMYVLAELILVLLPYSVFGVELKLHRGIYTTLWLLRTRNQE